MTRPISEDAPGRSGVVQLRVADLEGRIAGVEIAGKGRLGTSAHRRSGLCPAGERQTGISEDSGYPLTIGLIAVTLLLDRWGSPCRFFCDSGDVAPRRSTGVTGLGLISF